MTIQHKSFAPTVHLPCPIEPDRAVVDALGSLITADKDRDGRCILARAPDANLRSLLQVRLYKLQAALVAARPGDLAQAIAQMLLGFGSARASEEDAEAVVTQYVTVLANLPLWAVQRACRRFASGSVTKAECPDWKRAFAPSSAQLCHLAQGLVQTFYVEERRIADALNGIPRCQRTEEERERVIRGFGELQQAIKPKQRASNRPLQPIGQTVSSVLQKAIRERDELQQWSAERTSAQPRYPTDDTD